MRPYRDWMTPMNLEVMGSLGGSLVSDNILDYYADPIEVGYGPLVDFDHDFIGRHALAEKIKSQKRKKVTLVWSEGDVTDVIRSSLFAVDSNGKFMNMPLSVYSTFQCDEVTKNGGAQEFHKPWVSARTRSRCFPWLFSISSIANRARK